jgi:DNA replication protein DnaC
MAAIDRARAATEPHADARAAAFAREEAAAARADRDGRLRAAGAALKPAMQAAIVLGKEPTATESGRRTALWLQDDRAPRTLVLQGATGCGKTVAACWALAQHRHGGRIRSASAVAMLWPSTRWQADAEREALIGCGVLVLDDVGAEHASRREWVAVAMRDILELRQREQLRTILTTNLPRRQLEQAYGDERVTSRLSEALWVTDPGRDLRRKP